MNRYAAETTMAVPLARSAGPCGIAAGSQPVVMYALVQSPLHNAYTGQKAFENQKTKGSVTRRQLKSPDLDVREWQRPPRTRADLVSSRSSSFSLTETGHKIIMFAGPAQRSVLVVKRSADLSHGREEG